MKRLQLFIPLFLLAFFFCNNSFAQSGFLKIDGVAGESTDAKHRDWIDVLSFSQAASRAGGTSTGMTRRRGAAVLEDMVITKKLDRTSPKLTDLLLKGQVVPMVTLELVNSGRIYYTVVMSNVMISSFKNNGNCGNQCPVTEEISLSFERITWTYTDASGSKTTSTYSVEKGM